MEFLLYLFIGGALLSGFLVISLKNPVYSVFYLILTFCFSSCVLLLLTVDFLSIIFIVVYVGAIAVLFLFIVMMLNVKLAYLSESFITYIPLSLFLGFIFISELFFVLNNNFYFSNDLNNFHFYKDFINYLNIFENIYLIGDVVYTHYFLIFILSGAILLLAMIGTICLTLHHSLNVRRQEVYKQTGRDPLTAINFVK